MPKPQFKLLSEEQVNKLLLERFKNPAINTEPTVTVSTDSLKNLVQYCYTAGSNRHLMHTEYKQETK